MLTYKSAFFVALVSFCASRHRKYKEKGITQKTMQYKGKFYYRGAFIRRGPHLNIFPLGEALFRGGGRSFELR